MRHLLILFLLLGAFSAYAQSVLVDSNKEGTSFGDPPRRTDEFAKADGLISEALMYTRNWNVT